MTINSLQRLAVVLVMAACVTPPSSSLAADAPAKPAAPRYLIIHADDAGMCHSANRATAEALEKGIVTSCSVMMPCPWVTEFADYARAHPQFDYGVHLTLNCEWKQYRWGPIVGRDKAPSLVDEHGYLWSNVEQVARHARADQVALELRAQVDRAKKLGIPLSHLDTHMGALVSRPDLVNVYVELGLQYDLPVLFFRKADLLTSLAYPALREAGPPLVARLQQRRLPLLDGLVQFYGGDSPEARRENYLRAIKTLPAGVSQLIIHCGVDDDELRAVTNSAGRRDEDRRVFTAPETARLIRDEGIRLINWRQLRELEAKAPSAATGQKADAP